MGLCEGRRNTRRNTRRGTGGTPGGEQEEGELGHSHDWQVLTVYSLRVSKVISPMITSMKSTHGSAPFKHSVVSRGVARIFGGGGARSANRP